MDQEVSIRIRSSFQVEGAEEAQAATEGLREEFRALAEAVEEAANRLGERFPQAVQRLAEPPPRVEEAASLLEERPPAVQRLAEPPPRVEEKVPPSQVVERLELEALTPRQGELYVDVARRALEAGELDRAGQALYRAAQAGEPEHLIRRLGAELLLARRAQARVEEDEENPQAEHLRRRVEAMLPTLAAQIASGRLVQAERGLAGAEAYLEQVRALEGNTEELRRLEEALKGHKATLEEAKKAQEAQAQGRGVDARGALSRRWGRWPWAGPWGEPGPWGVWRPGLAASWAPGAGWPWGRGPRWARWRWRGAWPGKGGRRRWPSWSSTAPWAWTTPPGSASWTWPGAGPSPPGPSWRPSSTPRGTRGGSPRPTASSPPRRAAPKRSGWRASSRTS
ncbi:hypothetical protein [Thermus sp.]|uniref:hypothetical protein n=1 Tax=Thermus sp. TaxID=275 RepID=UPI00298EEA27|nr:hypothetical protein [Thermus sp.]MDW8358116.1 hypothetical protein [Thermus sp.]